jgi:hypothetical protein
VKLAVLLENNDRTALLHFQQMLTELDWESELIPATPQMIRPMLKAKNDEGCFIVVALADEGYELLGWSHEIIDYGQSLTRTAEQFEKARSDAIDHGVQAFREEFSDEAGEIASDYDGPERVIKLKELRTKYMKNWKDNPAQCTQGACDKTYGAAIAYLVKRDLDGLLKQMW